MKHYVSKQEQTNKKSLSKGFRNKHLGEFWTQKLIHFCNHETTKFLRPEIAENWLFLEQEISKIHYDIDMGMQYEQECANQMVYLIAQMFYVFLFLISLGGIKTRQAATIVDNSLWPFSIILW